jgi:hypothetical protein
MVTIPASVASELEERNPRWGVSVAPGEGAIMAVPEGTRAPLVDGSQLGPAGVRSLDGHADQPQAQGGRTPEVRGTATGCSAIDS